MSDTPETDAQTLVHSVTGSSLYCVSADFARKLERERNEAQTYANKLADGLPTGMLPRDVENLREANAGLADDLQKAEQERDEARAALQRITESDMRWSKKIARDALEAKK